VADILLRHAKAVTDEKIEEILYELYGVTEEERQLIVA